MAQDDACGREVLRIGRHHLPCAWALAMTLSTMGDGCIAHTEARDNIKYSRNVLTCVDIDTFHPALTCNPSPAADGDQPHQGEPYQLPIPGVHQCGPVVHRLIDALGPCAFFLVMTKIFIYFERLIIDDAKMTAIKGRSVHSLRHCIGWTATRPPIVWRPRRQPRHAHASCAASQECPGILIMTPLRDARCAAPYGGMACLCGIIPFGERGFGTNTGRGWT